MERELWKSLYLLAVQLDKPWGCWLYSTSEVLGVYFWAVVHDRPTSWAVDAQAWPDDLRPVWLPAQSTLSRRLRRTEAVELMTAVEQHLVALLALGQYWVHIMDGKALAVSAVSKDPDAGYGRGAGTRQKGYKLHAIWSSGPMPVAWCLAPMNASEKTVAGDLIPTLSGGGYILADTQFDVGCLYDLATAHGFQLVTKKTAGRSRNGLGHRRQSPARLRSIELLKSSFGRALYNLPAWVRRFQRVRPWVQAKSILAGLKWLLQHEPIKLALA